MRTRIVYVATTTNNDIYLEQVWVSAFSLKHFNPTANITVVCDHTTTFSLKTDGRENIRTVVEEIIEVYNSRALHANAEIEIMNDFQTSEIGNIWNTYFSRLID